MTELFAVETPTLVVDLDRVERNLAEMAELCRAHGKTLRPHAKTHKSVELARLQMEQGAIGLTVAKLGEAEVFAHGGIDDIFVAYPIVGEDKLERLIALARRIRLSTIVDDVGAARALAIAALSADLHIDVLVKVDLGMHRVGVSEGRVDEVAHRVAGLEGLRLRGICIHEGNMYSEPDPALRRDLARDTVRRLVGIAERLRRQGLPIDVVSCGATPSVRDVLDMPGLTEVRPGNYVYYDAMQVALGVVPQQRCALSVLSTVVSRRDDSHAIIDAGAKALTLDRGVHGLSLLEGFGTFPDREGIELVGLSEEHGWLRTAAGERLCIGERLTLLPNHACATVANFTSYTLVRGGDIVGDWKVAARGRLT